MLKDHDPPKDKASEIATRKWGNNDLRRRIIEAKQRPKLVDPNKGPEIGETFVNVGRVDGPVNRFESKFKREIRAMMEQHKALNLAIYVASIENRRRRLLTEKLRRLKAAQQNMEEVGK